MKTGRNAPCPCGSGLKFKKCCIGKQDQLFEKWFEADLARGAENLKASRERFEKRRSGIS